MIPLSKPYPEQLYDLIETAHDTALEFDPIAEKLTMAQVIQIEFIVKTLIEKALKEALDAR